MKQQITINNKSMKSKNYLLWGLALALVFTLNSCKSKESAYKAAYEAAKAKEEPVYRVEETTPVTKSADWTYDAVQVEKVTAIDGASIRQFSVVIGSFQNKTNAVSQRDKMINQGYKALIAQNARGMYRVIIATFGDRASAAAERDRVKTKHYPDFQDAWILNNQ